MADADEHRTAVGLWIIHAEWEGDARGEGAKVVVVDRGGDALPLPAGILEVAHQFALLGIDTDDGIAVTAEATSQPGNVGGTVGRAMSGSRRRSFCSSRGARNAACRAIGRPCVRRPGCPADVIAQRSWPWFCASTSGCSSGRRLFGVPITSRFERLLGAFFFHWLAARARFAYPLPLHFLRQELLASTCHRARIQLEQRGQFPIAPATQLQRFQAGI